MLLCIGLIASALLFGGSLGFHNTVKVLVSPADVLVTEGENATFYCEVDDLQGLYWIFNDTNLGHVYLGDEYMNNPFGEGLYVDSSYEYRSDSYWGDITQSNLTVAFAGLHQDNITVQCCSLFLYYCNPNHTGILRVQNLQEPLNMSLELVNKTGAVRLTWELPPGLDPSIITHYTVAVTGDEQLFNSTAVNVTDTYFTYTLPWLAWQQQPTCSLVNFSVSAWNVAEKEGNQAHQNAFLCSFRELEVEQVYVECECDGDSSSAMPSVAQTPLPTVVSSCPGNTMAFVGSAIPVILLLCMGNIILVLVIIFMCIKMNKIKTTLSDSRRKSEPKDENIVMEENNAYEMVKMGRPGGTYEQQPQLTAATSAECRDKFKQFRVAAPATVTTDGPTVASRRRAETVVPVPPIPGPVPTVSHVHTHVPLVGSQLDDEAPPPPIPPRYHDDQ